MRVLFVVSDLGLHGAQKQVVELARELDRRGREVAIYTLNAAAARAADLRGTGVEVIVDQKRSKLDAGVILRLRRRIVDWGTDIVHGFLFDGDIYARIAALGTGATVLNSERGWEYTLSGLQRVAHWLTKPMVDGVVANTHAGSEFAQRLYGYRPAQMHVVGNGMRIEEFLRKSVSSVNYREEFFGEGDHRVLCMVGHIKPSKDYILALETAAALVRETPQWRVLFLGEALSGLAYKGGHDSDTQDYKRSVMEHFHRLQIADKVKFAGARNDAPAILAQSDVLLMTSRNEGFPNAVLEAMVVGVPVVSTEYSDIRRILPRAEQVVSGRSPQALMRAVLHVQQHRLAIAAEQRRWVDEHASIEVATKELERVYANYIRRHRRPQPA